jgi:hypothetical protein
MRAALRLTLDLALSEIVGVFDERGIRAMLLKGPAFAHWLYEDPYERSYGDVDLLVAPEQLAVAGAVLAECGFAPGEDDWRLEERADHHEKWVRGGKRPAFVELHHTLCLLSAPPSLVWRRMSEDARTIEVAGARVEIPAPTASALVVALHATQHGVADATHMRDLREALARVDLETWRAAASLAFELGAEEAFAAGLRLDPRGCELADRLGLPAVTDSRVLRLRATTPPAVALGIERLVSTPGAIARARMLVAELFPSSGLLRALYPVARRGRLGLMAAYVYRPVDLAVKLPPALRAWRRAAR